MYEAGYTRKLVFTLVGTVKKSVNITERAIYKNGLKGTFSTPNTKGINYAENISCRQRQLSKDQILEIGLNKTKRALSRLTKLSLHNVFK